MASLRTSRGGFVVVKLLVDDTICFLLRRNLKWKDVNFIGGHEKDRDHGKLIIAAQRELWEEVPSVRDMQGLQLEVLTDEVCYGPVLSRSVGRETNYEVQFFLLKIERDPAEILNNLGARTLNVLVSQKEILKDEGTRVSGLVHFLNKIIPSGIGGIPLSSPVNIKPVGRWAGMQRDQLEFAWV